MKRYICCEIPLFGRYLEEFKRDEDQLPGIFIVRGAFLPGAKGFRFKLSREYKKVKGEIYYMYYLHKLDK